MKRFTSQNHSPLTILSLAIVLLAAAEALAAGKTIKIEGLPYTIMAPGNYVLAKDMQYDGLGILVQASHVDLDLGGHTLLGKAEYGAGVRVESQANVRIHHGTIRGFTVGVDLWNAVDCTLDHLIASQSGFCGMVVNLSTGLTVTRNTANDNGTFGIFIDGRSTASKITWNIASQNWDTGIFVSGDSFANWVTDNTASDNRLCGISIFCASDNTVTDNVTINNGDRGLNLVSAIDNTVTRNKSDRNPTGIHVGEGSRRNLVARNSATANASEGIRLLADATENTIRDNELTGSYVGIILAIDAGADHNLIQRNKVTFNVLGISIEAGSTDNTVEDNTVTGNRDFDLVDQNSGCDSNIWVDNNFETDRVDFKDDGGPDAGCIR